MRLKRVPEGVDRHATSALGDADRGGVVDGALEGFQKGSRGPVAMIGQAEPRCCGLRGLGRASVGCLGYTVISVKG